MGMQFAKLLGIVLAAACGVLFLLAVAMQFGFGRGYSWLPIESQPPLPATAAAIDRTAFKLPPESEFAATQERPLFNADRQPTPETADEPDTPPPPKVPLNVALTGVILTPDLHVAMVHDKSRNVDIALKEGMPLEGDQGGWTLTHVNPRSAVFRESGGDEVEVELSTAVAGPKPNAVPGANVAHGRTPPGTPVAGRPTAPEVAANPQAQALQKRIEERREQMRAEAERLREQKKQQQQQH